jgi:hypothetical protein
MYLKIFILFLLQPSGENLRIFGDIFMQMRVYFFIIDPYSIDD